MDQHHRNLLRSNRVFLVNELSIDDGFLSVFVGADLFTQNMYEEILNKPTSQARAAAFLDLLVRRGPEAFPTLIEALVETKHYHVASKLDPDLTAVLRARKPAPSSSKYVKPMEETVQPSTIQQPVSGLDEQPIMSTLIEQMKCLGVKDTITAAFLKEVQLGDVYNLRRKPRGRALIINNSEFKAPLQPREGAAFDGTNLCEMFESLFFNTELHENKTARELKQLLLNESGRPEHADADAFVLCILSHGARGKIYGVDGGEVEVETHIIQMFNGSLCPNLMNKPKIIIIQACQGEEGARGVIKSDGPLSEEEVQEDEKLRAALDNLAIGDTKDSVPELRQTHDLADILVAYATCPGYKSFRQTNLGSWFVRAMIKEMCAHAHKEHIEDILIRVRRAVLEQKTNGLWFDKPHYIQLTETRSTLVKKLHLFPGYAESKC